MGRQIVHTDAAPAAIGPYSQAVVSRGVVTTAGQIALDPQTGEMVGAGDVRIETEQALKNLKEILNAAGSTLGLCLRCDVFLADMADFEAMNEVYATHFETDPPARITVQAAGLPKDARVEIAAIAAVLE
ncbi:MAG: Rid family detoxifying hydrolase [Miltoncostaeaceae bacterium]